MSLTGPASTSRRGPVYGSTPCAKPPCFSVNNASQKHPSLIESRIMSASKRLVMSARDPFSEQIMVWYGHSIAFPAPFTPSAGHPGHVNIRNYAPNTTVFLHLCRTLARGRICPSDNFLFDRSTAGGPQPTPQPIPRPVGSGLIGHRKTATPRGPTPRGTRCMARIRNAWVSRPRKTRLHQRRRTAPPHRMPNLQRCTLQHNHRIPSSVFCTGRCSVYPPRRVSGCRHRR